jgi:hypothetical protein
MGIRAYNPHAMFPNDMALDDSASLLCDLKLVAFHERACWMIRGLMTYYFSRDITAIEFDGPPGVRVTQLRMQRL